MSNLEKRIAALEGGRVTGLAALTDEELIARIAELKEQIRAEEIAQGFDTPEVRHVEP